MHGSWDCTVFTNIPVGRLVSTTADYNQEPRLSL